MTTADRSDPEKAPVRRRRWLIVLAVLSTLGLAAACLVWRPSWLSSLIGRHPHARAAAARIELALQEHPPRREVRGGRGVCALPCGDRRGRTATTRWDARSARSTSRQFPDTDSPSFQAQGLEYSVERRGDRVFHKEIKRDASGKVVSQIEAEARYVIGSGEQAMAFLLERGDGYLFESPITWYSRKQKWDLSPGYEKDNLHFERFIKPTCLFCHSNQFDHVEGTENRYRQPIFLGHAIGCERCHGPGELHVRKPERVGDELPNIVNPARLQPALREAVCQQCHLQGDIRVVRAGRSLTDYRPGLPLSSIESVFVKAENLGKSRFFGQVEQMYESRCFRESSRQDGLHLVPRPPRASRPARESDLLSGSLPELSCREGMQPAEARTTLTGPGRSLH